MTAGSEGREAERAGGAPDTDALEAAAGPVEAGGVVVQCATGTLLAATSDHVERLLGGDVPARLAAADPTLWGADATPEATNRLGWLDAPAVSRELLPRLRDLRAALRADGVDHVVLAGMGGSSLAPEVISRTAGAELTVLDTTDPGQVRAALADRLDRTVLVVSSKSGGTVETDSHRRAYEQAFRDAGIDPASRIVVVTDPGSPLETIAKEAGYRAVFLADPHVGGRYSALTAFGLVPTALAGVAVDRLLDEAAALSAVLGDAAGNPALLLGAAFGGAAVGGRDKVVLADAGSGIAGFGDWAEQLLAESTGKEGKGLLPVVVEGPTAPGFAPAADVHLVKLVPAGTDGTEDSADAPPPDGTSVGGPLGAQFLAWEYATAAAGRVLGINPFDQPNVQESKDNTKSLLDEAGDGPLPKGVPVFTDGAVAVYADHDVLGTAADGGLGAALDALLAAVPPRGYLAIMAYLDRLADARAAQLRPALAARLAHPVTFGWGPRFLHSTGQYHKGGPQVGVYLQVTGAVTDDLPVPGRPYTFGRLQLAQALGDLGALRQRGRPAVRLHLLDRDAGLTQLLEVARG